MYCRSCGAQVDASSAYCGMCGATVGAAGSPTLARSSTSPATPITRFQSEGRSKRWIIVAIAVLAVFCAAGLLYVDTLKAAPIVPEKLVGEWISDWAIITFSIEDGALTGEAICATMTKKGDEYAWKLEPPAALVNLKVEGRRICFECGAAPTTRQCELEFKDDILYGSAKSELFGTYACVFARDMPWAREHFAKGSAASQPPKTDPSEMSINNLRQLGLVLKMFANESKGQLLPPLSKTPGCLMFQKELVFPEYLSDSSIMVSPLNSANGRLIGEGAINSNSYIYLGFALGQPQDVDLFFKMYEESLRGGCSLEKDLVEPGTGRVIYRVREGIERFFITDINNPSASADAQASIPVMFERRSFYKDGNAPVLFMDGHVEKVAPGQNKVVDRIFELLPQLEITSR